MRRGVLILLFIAAIATGVTLFAQKDEHAGHSHAEDNHEKENGVHKGYNHEEHAVHSKDKDEEKNHEDHGHEGHDQGGDGLLFSLKMQKSINLKVEKPRLMELSTQIAIPALIQSDPRYTSAVAASSRGILILVEGKSITSVGKRVEKGESLGRIIPSADQQHWTGVMLDLEKASVDRDLAEKEYNRIKGLVDKGLLPEKDLLAAQTAFNRAKAEMKSAKNRKAQLYGSQQTSIVLRASHDGVIKRINFRHGSLVDAGDIVFEIFSPEHLVVKAHMLQSDIHAIDEIRYGFLKIKDHIVKIEDVDEKLLNDELIFDPETMAAKLEVSIDNNRMLRVGDSIALHLGVGENRVYTTVPVEAVVDINTKPYLFIKKGAENFIRAAVKLGPTNGERVAVIKGIDMADEIVTSGGFEIYASSIGAADPHAGHNH